MIELLADHLEANIDLRVVALADGPFVGRLRERGREVQVLVTGRRLGIVWSAARLRGVIGRTAPDVVLANGVKAALVAAIAGLGRRTPLVWRRADMSWDGKVSAWVARRSSAIIAISPAVARTLPASVQPRVRMIWNGVPSHAPADAPDLRALAGIPLGGCMIGVVGRLTPSKGQMHVVEAMPAILRRVPEAHVVLIGSEDSAAPGFQAALWRRAEDLGVAERLRFTGFVPEARTLIAQLCVLAVPSTRDAKTGWQEGFGNVAAEALGAGVPVVAYASGALPDVLGDAALLVEEGDQEELGDSLIVAATDSDLRRRLRARGRKRFDAHYDFDTFLNSYRDLLLEVSSR